MKYDMSRVSYKHKSMISIIIYHPLRREGIVTGQHGDTLYRRYKDER